MTGLEISALITAIVPLIQFAFRRVATDKPELNKLMPHITGLLLAIGAHYGGASVTDGGGPVTDGLVGVLLGGGGRFLRDLLTTVWRKL